MDLRDEGESESGFLDDLVVPTGSISIPDFTAIIDLNLYVPAYHGGLSPSVFHLRSQVTSITVREVPEPSLLWLIVFGCFGFFVVVRERQGFEATDGPDRVTSGATEPVPRTCTTKLYHTACDFHHKSLI